MQCFLWLGVLALAAVGCAAGTEGSTCGCCQREPAAVVSIAERGLHFHTEARLSWFDANAWCRHHKMQLLSIETEAKDSLIKRAIAGSGDVFWTGGNDLEEEGRWTWHSSGRTFNFTAWGAEEPNNFNNQDHCMFVGYYAGSTHNVWLDAMCLSKHHFICEKLE